MSVYTQKDYEAIEAVVLESPRGRWFLNEFARRNRAADTLVLLEAIRKLERGMAGPSPHHMSDELAAQLHDLSETINATLDAIMTTEDVWGAVQELPEDAPDEVLIGQVRNTMEQLSLVRRQLDTVLAAQMCSTAPDDGGALTRGNLSFFENDHDLFEPGGEAAGGSAPVPPLPVDDEPEGTRGQQENAVLRGPGQDSPAPDAKAADRIVFIRRGSSKETSIPLADEADKPAPASRSQPGS